MFLLHKYNVTCQWESPDCPCTEFSLLIGDLFRITCLKNMATSVQIAGERERSHLDMAVMPALVLFPRYCSSQVAHFRVTFCSSVLKTSDTLWWPNVCSKWLHYVVLCFAIPFSWKMSCPVSSSHCWCVPSVFKRQIWTWTSVEKVRNYWKMFSRLM